MKTVFDNSMTAHVWASRSQPHGRSNNGNFYFEGRTLYSYGGHFAVGYHMPDEASGVVLLNSDSYSISTSKHQNEAWGATRHMTRASVPGLTVTAREIDRADMLENTARGRVWRVAKHLESVAYWPGAEAAALIYTALGATERVAEAKARYGQARIDLARNRLTMAREKRRTAEARRNAKFNADRTPEDFEADARDYLAKAVSDTGSRWAQENAEESARNLSRELFRDIKAAKAAKWTARLACNRRTRAVHLAAVRKELQRFDHARV